MISCIIGTRAQLVKMAPVILEIENRGWNLDLLFTGQHTETMVEMLDDFGVKSVPRWLYQGPEVKSIMQVIPWFLRCMRDHQARGRLSEKDVVLVHGDTFSTLLGALIGRRSNARVAHVECGLRSFKLLSPFPEELTRLAVFSLTDIAFCPGEWAAANLASYHFEVVNTEHNTLLDALHLMLKRRVDDAGQDERSQYGICSIHRFENVFFKKRLARIVNLITYAADRYPIRFVLHPVTRKKLSDFGLLDALQRHGNISLTNRMNYSDFVLMMRHSAFVITDGGSNQEELSYLGIPTFLMRAVTERQEGLDGNIVLGHHRIDSLRSFLGSLSRAKAILVRPQVSPSSIVVDRLAPFAL